MFCRHEKIALLSLVVLLVSCRDQYPASNTEAHNNLHGIVNDSKTVNEITLVNNVTEDGPRVRFPAGLAIAVSKLGTHDRGRTEIRKGLAYEAEGTLEFTPDKRLVPIVRKPDRPRYEPVSIRFTVASGPRNAQHSVGRGKNKTHHRAFGARHRQTRVGPA
jgi:hypothetical protein